MSTMSVAAAGGLRRRLPASTVPQNPPPTMAMVLRILENSTSRWGVLPLAFWAIHGQIDGLISARGRPMRPSKLTYYADFVVYPAVIVGLAAAGVAHARWAELAERLCAA